MWRLYSDGYYVEVGYLDNLPEISSVTVTFKKSFLNTNYSLLAIQTNQSTASDTEVGIQFTPSTVNTAILSCHYINPNNTTISWRVAGYVAIPSQIKTPYIIKYN